MTQPPQTAIDPLIFRQVLGHYPTGVCIITARSDAGEQFGMVVGSFTSVSLDPPLVAFLPDKNSRSWRQLESVGRFCVNILAEDQLPLCRSFSAKTGDKFAGVSHRISDNGSPVLDNVLAWIDCTTHAVHEAGDHMFVMGRVQAMEVDRCGEPLLFFRGGYGSFRAPQEVLG
jgi:3-hydroxy-9,10-secoandrosta-1,3,5(10)-triene-9,17-dione monooxygenase reductase component